MRKLLVGIFILALLVLGTVVIFKGGEKPVERAGKVIVEKGLSRAVVAMGVE